MGQATKGNGERPVLFWVAGGCAATAAIVALAYVLTTPPPRPKPRNGTSRTTTTRWPKPWPTRPSRTTPQDGDHRGGG